MSVSLKTLRRPKPTNSARNRNASLFASFIHFEMFQTTKSNVTKTANRFVVNVKVAIFLVDVISGICDERL